MSKKILIFTSREGHLSIAKAIGETLKKAYFETLITDLFSPNAYAIYMSFYRYFPSLFKIPFVLGQKQPFQKATMIYFEKMLVKEVKNALKAFQPDLIISTNLFYNPAINKVLDYQQKRIPFINIATDPWIIHKITFSANADLNLVYDEKGVKLGQKSKITEEKLIPSGWFVRKNFYQDYNHDNIRKKLDFKKNIFTLLICGGSEGMNMILKIIPAIITTKKAIQVIVVCGTNKTLYKALHSLKTAIPTLTKIEGLKNLSKQLNLKLFKFTNQLPQLMAVSDLIVGKAGPNLIFETTASKKPFMAICHISGQEDGNLDLIKKKKIGIVEENALKAIKILQKIINNPTIVEKFHPHILKERAYNLRAGKKLLEKVRTLI